MGGWNFVLSAQRPCWMGPCGGGLLGTTVPKAGSSSLLFAMSPLPSKILVGNLESCPPVPGRFFAFGERDDPMRLTVLMAQHMAERCPDSQEIRDKTQTCLDPRAPWRKRHRALEDALAMFTARSKGERPLFALVDLDALVPQGEEGWEDDRSLWMHKRFFRLIEDAVERGGWLVLRTCPSKRASQELTKLDVEIDSVPHLAADIPLDEVQLFAPEVRPVARWLLKEVRFQPRDLSRIVEQVDDPNMHLLDLAYQALSPLGCDAGKLLATLRPPQHYNGAIGPFVYADESPSATTLPHDAVEELREAGFLQSGGEPSTLRMPRLARELLGYWASLGMSRQLHDLHLRLAAKHIDTEPVAEQIEIHYHAVRAGDVALAKSTARFYGTELRDLAKQLSLEANSEKDKPSKVAKFRMAAELFEYVVHQFDETDAYAWEYFGFNLARMRDPSQNDRILDAYRRAHDLWQDNPLYHGRLLGFRGQLGNDVASEVMRSLDFYVSQYRDEEAVSRFAEAALRGLRRGGQQAQLDAILNRKRSLIEHFAPRALSKVEGDE